MKRFSFRLQKILDLKRIREQEAQRDLGNTLRDLNSKEEELKSSVTLKSAFDSRFHELGRKGIIDTIFFRRFQGYQVALQKDIEKQQEAVMKQEDVVNEARGNFQIAKRKTETLEKLEQGAKSSYWTEVNREEQNWMSEVALGRFRHRRESGNIALMLMAIGSIAFALTLLTFGLLFATGALDSHRAKMIMQIMRYSPSQETDYERLASQYKEGLEENQNLQAYLIRDGKVPHFILKSDYDRMKMKADEYDKIMADDVDEDVVITQEVHHHRRSLLHRYERSIQSMHKTMMEEKDEAGKQLEKAEATLAQANMERKNMAEAKAQAMDAKREQAMNDILQSFNSMDPEDIVKVLTAGQEPGDIGTLSAQQSTVKKVADYMSRMSARKRAGVLQALSADWAKLVVQHLEGNSNSL
jgi:flagellar export protein FliJ